MSEHVDDETGFLSTGEQLKRAREAKGLSLDDVANQTRIPIRHLQNIEREDWDALPAPTYAVGFVRNYANAVGLDGAAIAVALRERIGGAVRTRAPAPEYYEPADPSRVPPRGLVLGALLFAALLILGYFFWFSSWSTDQSPEPGQKAAEAPAAAPAQQPLQPQNVSGQPVVLAATGEVWLRIIDAEGGGQLFSGSLNAGQTFAVPATARRPVIRTGRPQMLRASVGGRDLGPLAPEERTIDNVSLLSQDLATRAQAGPAQTPAAAPAQPPRTASRPSPQATPARAAPAQSPPAEPAQSPPVTPPPPPGGQ